MAMSIKHTIEGMSVLVDSINDSWTYDIVQGIDYTTGLPLEDGDRAEILDYLLETAQELTDSLRSFIAQGNVR